MKSHMWVLQIRRSKNLQWTSTNTLATNMVVNDDKKLNVCISRSTWFWETVYSSFCHAQAKVSKYKQKTAQKNNWPILSNQAKPSIRWYVKHCIFFVVFLNFLNIFWAFVKIFSQFFLIFLVGRSKPMF